MLKKLKKIFDNKKKKYIKNKYAPVVAVELRKKLAEVKGIPVILVSYNNGVYVENFCKQLTKFGIKPIIIDNSSTDQATVTILQKLNQDEIASVVYSKANFGHLVGFIDEIYHVLPETFAYSDPDLELNSNLPNNFMHVLSELALEYKVYKAGFALPTEIEEPLFDKKVIVHRPEPFNFLDESSIKQWEERFWRFKLPHESLEIYAATIDTTFAVYHKSNYFGNFEDAIRVGGEYSALHLPWFKNLDLFDEENRRNYQAGNVSSNWI